VSGRGWRLVGEADLSRLEYKEELGLIKLMIEFPSLIKLCLEKFDPQPLTDYLLELAVAFHQLYHQGNLDHSRRFVSDDEKLTHARVKLIQGLRIVFRNGLAALGLSAPERM